MTNPALDLLNNVYGYDQFRGQQQAVIDAAVAGQDCLVLMPTGGGKSLCYQIPSLIRDGVGIVVSPLIALMQDQVSALQQLGVGAAYLNSSLTPAQQQQVVNLLAEQQLDILYIAPERLVQPRTLQLLAACPLSVIAIDEAHCVSQWGHDFRQDYMALNLLRQHFPSVPRMALTATADERTRDEIAKRLELNQPEFFISGFDRPNIRYSVQPKSDAKRQLLRFLTGHRNQSGIVYCMSRKKVESIAQWLVTHGFNALPYHAGLAAGVRTKNQHRFLNEDAVVMVATIAFGMGIDKPDLRFVAHLDLPKSMEAYYQETGRAGRDGLPSEAWMVYGLQDVVRLRQMAEESTAADAQKRVERHKLDALLGWCEVNECRRRSLLAYFGEAYEQDCGNCDICLTPPTTWDATVAAQKLLSCVIRTGQRFGAGHVVDVLLGKQTDKIRQHGHASLSVYGIGADLSSAKWRSVIRQLIVHGFLRTDFERFSALVLTAQSRPLLRGETTLMLREDLSQPKKRKTRPEKQALADQDKALWEALRECRKRLAEEHGVPPYVIFHDATLMEMMEYRPSDQDQLLTISGVGQAKLERYGRQFLDVINER